MQRLTNSVILGILFLNLTNCAILDLRPTPGDVVSVYTTSHPGEHDALQHSGVYKLILRNVFQRFTQPIANFFYHGSNRNHNVNNTSIDSDDEMQIQVFGENQSVKQINYTTGKNGKTIRNAVIVNTTNTQDKNASSIEDEDGRKETSRAAAVKLTTEFVDLDTRPSNDSLVEEIDDPLPLEEDDSSSAEATTKRHDQVLGSVSGEALMRFVESLTSALSVAIGALSALVFRSFPRGQKIEEDY